MKLRISCLYEGWVMHQRLRPRAHRLRYRLLSFLLDLDEIEELHQSSRWFSRNRFNLFSFYDADYGDGSGLDLRAQIERHLDEAGIGHDGGAIRLLTMPRIVGCAFNPLSVYFCYRREGDLAAIYYEVNNTFGQRHAYLIPSRPEADGTIRQRCTKDFHVSPFMDLGLDYRFRLSPPAEQLSMLIRVSDGEGLLLTAAHSARHIPISDIRLLRCFLSHPMQMIRVLGGIHWEALRLLLKGMKVRPRPAPPAQAVTSISPNRQFDHG